MINIDKIIHKTSNFKDSLDFFLLKTSKLSIFNLVIIVQLEI